MKQEIRIGKNNVVLTDKNYIAAGGQAKIYKHDTNAIKIYHDDNKMIPLGKINELSVITNNSVIKPRECVFNNKGKLIGYSMDFLDNSKHESLCKFFTKSFKVSNSISGDMVVSLVKNLQLIIQELHNQEFLVVDLNELNILVEKFIYPLLIDTDSFQTPSYPATAIMDSIRDRKLKTFSELTDWFSFAVISYYLYINIHPYRARHPGYKPDEWNRRMDEGASNYDNNVSFPPICNHLDVIPRSHRFWLESIFKNGERSVPPLPDDTIVQPIPQQIIVKSNESFNVTEYLTLDSDVRYFCNVYGVDYSISGTSIYIGKQQFKNDVVKLLKSPGIIIDDAGLPVLVGLRNNKLICCDLEGKLSPFETGCSSLFIRNNSIYSIGSNRLIEITLSRTNNRIFGRIKELENVSIMSSRLFPGLIVQDLLSKQCISVPYSFNKSTTKILPELDGYRIIFAQSKSNIVIVAAEKKGRYDRFIIVFSSDFLSYSLRKHEDIELDNINFAILDNGVCVLLHSHDIIEVFHKNNIKQVKNPPFDYSMPLYGTSRGIFFTNGNSVFKVSLT